MWEHYFDYGLGGCIKHLIEVRWVVTLDYPANSHHSHWQHHLLMLVGLRTMMIMAMVQT